MKTHKKFSDTSVRVLETLKLLLKTRASIQDIIGKFEKIDPNNRIYTSEAILKYINTLKVFGFRFVKEKDKYVLLNTPSQFNFDEKDLRAIYLINKLSESFPENTVKLEISKFLSELEKGYSDNTKLLSSNIAKPEFVDLKLDYSKYQNKIKEYEKYCIEGQRLKITYTNLKNIEATIMAEPNEIKYIENDVYLSVYNPFAAQIQDINFNSIIQVEQLPLKTNRIKMLSSVTFLLKGRLTKNYKLHDGEKLLQIKSDGCIVILSQNEDKVLLLKRLMRYGENCEVISPKHAREEIKEMIKSSLSNYY